jgi:hypothetical protein
MPATERADAGVRAHQVHQARTRPIGVAVEAGLVGFVAFFAVAGERRIDQALVERGKLVVSQPEPGPHGGRKVGDKDVGVGRETMQHRLAFRLGEIERQASLVAGLQQPGEIVGTGGIARQIRQVAIGIARSRRLDLDHFGAEIRQHGCGRGCCDETRAVQNLEAFEDAVFHGALAPVIVVGFCV